MIPRQNFEITIQGCVGSKVLSSTSIRGYRKDVTAKLYGGDVTRKMKLLKKQKEGKKKMKKIGNVEIPREAFYKFLSTSASKSLKKYALVISSENAKPDLEEVS